MCGRRVDISRLSDSSIRMAFAMGARRVSPWKRIFPRILYWLVALECARSAVTVSVLAPYHWISPQNSRTTAIGAWLLEVAHSNFWTISLWLLAAELPIAIWLRYRSSQYTLRDLRYEVLERRYREREQVGPADSIFGRACGLGDPHSSTPAFTPPPPPPPPREATAPRPSPLTPLALRVDEEDCRVLGVSPGRLTLEELERAYRDACLSTHPDKRSGHEDRIEDFQRVQEAYRALRVEVLRG